MIAKNKKGKSFGGCVRYVLNEGHEILAAEGVDADDAATVTRDFAIQRSGRPEIMRPVGHIAVSFSPDDSARMTNDFMLSLAHEYMQEMGIRNTQYIVVRHHNTGHEHFHIVYNRIDNDLKLISVNNDYHRNVAACKKLKDRHGLTYGTGKERVNRAKLTGTDRVKYQIYDEIAANLPKCATYADLEKRLRQGGITVQYKYRSGAEELSENIQGISFRKGDYSFKGSQVDRAFSHANLSKTFDENRARPQVGRGHRASADCRRSRRGRHPASEVIYDVSVREFLSGDGATVQLPEQTAATLPAPEKPSSAAQPESTKPQARRQQIPAPEESRERESLEPSAAQPERARQSATPLPEQTPKAMQPVTASPERSREQEPPTSPKPQETATQLDLFASSQPSAQETPKQPEPLAPSERQKPPAPPVQADPDTVKREIREAITDGLPHATHYGDLEERLQKAGITIRYKYRSGAKQTENNIQGVSFEKDGLTFKGSDIDRKFSHTNLSETLKQNWADWFKANMEPDIRPVRRSAPPEPQQPPTTPQERREQQPYAPEPSTLKQPDPEAVRREIHKAITANLPKCALYTGLERRLQKEGITIHYKYRNGALHSPDNIQGISFEKDGLTFKGSEIDRAFSHANLSQTLNHNFGEWLKSKMEPPAPQQPRTPEATKQPEPPRAVKRYPVVFGVELDGRQFETLKSGGHILLDGMEREDGSGRYSAFVFLNDEQTRVFRCEDNPDRFVRYGGYEIRLRDKRQVEAGFTTQAVIRLSDGELTGARLWKDKQDDTGYNVSWDDPRVAQQQRERERQAANDSSLRPPAPDRTTPAAPATKEQFEKANKEQEERLRRNYSPPKIIQTKGPKIGRRR